MAGCIAALSLPPLCFIPALPLALGVLYQAVGLAPTKRQAALWAFLFGMGFYTAGLYWLTNAILTRVEEFWWAVPFAAPGVALLIAPLFIVPALLCRLVPEGWPRLLLFAGSWTLADMARVFYFSGFPWNPLGSVLELPGYVGDVLIQPASLIGVDGLTFMVVLASLALWQGRRAALGVCVCTILWCGWGAWRVEHHAHHSGGGKPAIAIVQGNVPEDDVLERDGASEQFESYLQLTARAVADARAHLPGHLPVVIWPESAFPGLLDEDEWARQTIATAAAGAPVLLGSDRRAGKGRWYNSLIALAADGHIEAIYDKSRLVPFGEYEPWILPFHLLPAVVVPGLGLTRWDLPQIGRVGPMVCYEIIFSGSVVASGQRPEWLLTISNDAWYGNSAGPRQHLATGRMRAVEEGLPVVFANNRGVSAIYDAEGRDVGHTKWGKEQTLIRVLPDAEAWTVFTYIGRWGPFTLAILSVLMAVWGGYGRKQKHVHINESLVKTR
ncbi:MULTISPECIES: apolipoprotein N-acyltransferase [unclassified Bombella]|uniref:apolipoprotein N-acyltransferase n=1 Tax=unclassified Bombella TaxID=2644098 RepID=UPI001E3BA971|nr:MULTISPECIES: apolipoprotein N-acyltransferase [unclassified Bombella]MCT6855619.1 apolipoprotein N-acyltransferase [Bombella apis]